MEEEQDEAWAWARREDLLREEAVARHDALGHADPRTTRRYDRSRHHLDHRLRQVDG